MDNIELDALKAKYTDLLSKNKHLFARAKKAEGFEPQDDGSWVKTEKPKAEKTVKSDDKLSERYDNIAKKLAGVVEADEVEFFDKWRVDNGYENTDIDSVLGKKGFKTELTDFRTAKTNLAATTDIKGEKGESGVKGNPDYWIAKATKGPDGKLLFPEETPRELFPKIVAKMAEKEPGSSDKLEFYNK